jgi:hypothetical protein
MPIDPTDPVELEDAITTVYRGPLEDFITRRDALSKQLRASKRKDDADVVKALRKPSRMAWALDQVVFEDPDAVEDLAKAITDAQAAHGRADDARAAQENVKAVVRAVAEAGARAAIRGGHPIESAELVAAVRAVIGEADAFAVLRTGRLVDVPEAGGLDLLAAMSLGASPAPLRAAAPATGKRTVEPTAAPAGRKTKDQATSSSKERSTATIASRAELNRAESSVAKARHHAQAAERVARSLEARLEAAEQQLQRVQEQVETRRAELERAREDARTAAAAVDEAEQALAELRVDSAGKRK